MARAALSAGILLILVGLIGYFGTGTTSITALIPAFLGLPIAVLGKVAENERLRKHAMHGAVLIALLGLIGSIGGLFALPGYLAGATAERPVALLSEAATAIITLVFIVASVRSFIQARRAG
ncbi:MAG: hypothetical protein WD535_03460 [Thermaerobacterales bacterium]